MCDEHERAGRFVGGGECVPVMLSKVDTIENASVVDCDAALRVFSDGISDVDFRFGLSTHNGFAQYGFGSHLAVRQVCRIWFVPAPLRPQRVTQLTGISSRSCMSDSDGVWCLFT